MLPQGRREGETERRERKEEDCSHDVRHMMVEQMMGERIRTHTHTKMDRETNNKGSMSDRVKLTTC